MTLFCTILHSSGVGRRASKESGKKELLDYRRKFSCLCLGESREASFHKTIFELDLEEVVRFPNI